MFYVTQFYEPPIWIDGLYYTNIYHVNSGMVDGSFFQALHRACYGSLRGGGAADSEGHLLRSYKLVAKKAVDIVMMYPIGSMVLVYMLTFGV